MNKKIYRNTQDKMISGVCSGLAQYFNIDPTIVRLIWVILSLFVAGFPGLILYIVCAIIIPEQNVYNNDDYTQNNNNTTYYTPPTDKSDN